LALLAFALGCLAFLGSEKLWASAFACRESYDLVNPSSLCDRLGDAEGEWAYEPLRASLIRKIDDYRHAGKLAHISVFFRDLRNGPRFGIQEYEDFYTASLLKVPIMMVILHAADRQPGLLDQQLTSPDTLSPVSNVDHAEETIQPRTAYTVRELLHKMIVYSDNDSADLLLGMINAAKLPADSNAFLDLGAMNMMSGKMGKLSMQAYSTLFAILYNAAYLSDAHSQMALDLLARSTYKDGLAAGVPEGTRVAHKFGYHVLSPTETQLHDCGIVYSPALPYVLCVMTSGSDIKSEAAAIADISQTVYEAVDTAKP
jgi:beta-lactamase class A